MQAQNTFNEGMVLDNHPLMTPNTVLTDALNATLVTMNGNEMVLQNDMGNAKVENAKLPPGYIPIGMKEYGGIIYIACYNPLTNKGQIGCFPSPQRQKTATQISEITPTFKFPDVTYIKEENGEEWYKINSLLTKCEIFPKGTIIRSGDKFSVGLPIASMFGTDNIDFTGEHYISNYNNVENGLVKTPMNRMYTFGVATLDNNGQLRDITNQLKRYKGGQQIQFSNIDSDLYKFNCGYWQNEMSTKDKDGLVSSELMDQTSVQSKLNTYNSKLFGRLFLYAKYNAIDNVDISIVGYKKSEITNDIKNPIYLNTKNQDDDKNIIKIDSPIVLFIYANYKYNCPDGSADLNKRDDLPKPLEGYKYYFDKYRNSNIIRGLLFTLKINNNTTQQLLEFNIPSKDNENYTVGYGYPVYDSITNLYSFSQLFTLPIKSSLNQTIKWSVIPIMRFFDNGKPINGGLLPDKGVNGSLDTGNINSGVMKLNTWNYYISGDRINLRWGYESYPRDNDVIRDVTFRFYDIATDEIVYNNGTVDIDSSTPRWTYITKNRLSYNGTFSENFDINNFISNKASTNIFAPNKLFYVRISYTYNTVPREDYRWMLITGLYNPSYWGTEEYSSIQDYNDFLKCYYTSNGKYYIFNYGRTELDLNIVTQEGHSIVTQKGHHVGGTQYIESKYGTWKEVTKGNIGDKQRIPEEYYNMKVTASLQSSNTLATNYVSSGKFISSNITDVPDSVNEIYETSGSLTSTISLNNNVPHALNISKWVPTIIGVETKHTSNIEYEGDIEDSQKLQLELNGVKTTTNNNTIVTTYTNTILKTIFGGTSGECSGRVLSPLSTLPELVSIAPKSSKILEHLYTIHTFINSSGKCDFKVYIQQVLSESQYYNLYGLTVVEWGNTESKSAGNGLVNYGGRIFTNYRDRYLNVNSSFKEQFAKLPRNYNIIVLGSLPSLGEDPRHDTVNTSIVKLQQYGSMQYEVNDWDREEEYPGNIFVLIRDITGEFTLVNYIDYNINRTDIDAMRPAWENFIDRNIKDYNYYNSEQSQKLYSITSNQYYSKDYKVFINYNIKASISSQIFKKDYLSVLENFQNSQVMTLNIDAESDTILNNIPAENTICTIPSAKHFIEDIANNTSIVYIGTEDILQQDSEGNPLKEGAVYKYVSGKGLVKNNQLKIQDNMLYTCNVGTKLKTYPQYGWSSKDSNSHCTATLGGISMITLKNGSSYNI